MSIVVWALAVAVAAEPWSTTFRAEQLRELDAEMPRIVVAIGESAVAPADHLCRAIAAGVHPCRVRAMPARARRDPDVWLATEAGVGAVWVVRPVDRTGAMLVTVFDPRRRQIDGYAAWPHTVASPRSYVEDLELRLGELRREVEQLQGADPPGPEDEAAGIALLAAAVSSGRDFDRPGALEYLDALDEEYVGTEAQAAAGRIRRELDHIGSRAPALAVESWLHVPASMTEAPVLTTSEPTALYLFFEPWCVHSRAALPAVQAMQQEVPTVPVIAVTQLGQGTTAAQVHKLVAQLDLGFAIAEVEAAVPPDWGVVGVPVAVLVERGTVRWMGHPATLTSDMLQAVAPQP